jgi:HAD superfamily hydrolase (TIGR01549 family)
MPDKHSITDLFFDWDGTLVDSATTGRNAFTKTFDALGIEFTEEFYRANYSPNWYSMYSALGLSQDEWKRADELWLEYYKVEPVRMVDGAYDTLMAVADRGYKIGIVTSGTQSRVNREIVQLGLAALLSIVICNESVVHKKPHPEGLHHAMARTNARPEFCSYVGDAPEDIEMGRSAGVMTVGVRSSYPSSSRLDATKPDILIESISHLLLHF